MDYKWISVKDRLPEESGWYLVFAPTYSGGSSGGLACIDGLMFSKFKIAKNGNKTWSIEVGYHERPNCVMYWMPLPIPTEFGHYEGTHKDKWGGYMKTWVDNETGEKRCLP